MAKREITIEEVKRINDIICNLIIGNMKAGSTYKKAKRQALNRMKKEYPSVLYIWIKYQAKQLNIIKS
jgi:hypothetical protein